MIFVKYIQPANFNFSKISKQINLSGFFSEWESLPEDVKSVFPFDHQLDTLEAKKFDVVFSVYKSGLLLKRNINLEPCLYEKKILSLDDNYRLIRKHFSTKWIYASLLIRLLSNNWLKEIRAFIKSRNMKRKIYNDFPFFTEFENYQIRDKDKYAVSVILPTLNRYVFLKQILTQLASQTFPMKEIIVIDQSDFFNEKFYQQFDLPLKIIHSKSKGQWLARNEGVKIARSEILAFIDDDVVINSKWLENHIKCLDFFDASISAGIYLRQDGKMPETYKRFQFFEHLVTGNVVLKKEVFKKCGLFDKQFEKLRVGDTEFGLRAFKYGLKGVYNCFAGVQHVKALKGGLRESGTWDTYTPTNFFGLRPSPSVIYFYRRYFPNDHLWYALAIGIPLSFAPANIKHTIFGKIIGLSIFFISLPLVAINLIRSFKIANKMLKEGPKIEKL